MDKGRRLSLGRTSYKAVETDLRKQITSQVWKAGERIPSAREMAQHYGCSVNTVEKALQSMEESGFILRQVRKGTIVNPELKLKNKTGLIASFVVSIENPLWASAQRGIEDYLRKFGFSMISASHDMDPAKCRQTLDNLANIAVDGVILAPSDHDEQVKNQFQDLIRMLLARDVKVVLIDRYYHDLTVPYVTGDNISASYKMTKILIEHGHRRIGFVRNSRVSTFEERLIGFRQACFEMGLPDESVHDYMITTEQEDFREEMDFFCERLLRMLAENPVTALFTANDQIFMAVTRALSMIHMAVPDDISLATYDAKNIQLSYPYKITGVKQNFYGMGQLAAELLMNGIYAGFGDIQLGHIYPSDIIQGNSVAII